MAENVVNCSAKTDSIKQKEKLLQLIFSLSDKRKRNLLLKIFKYLTAGLSVQEIAKLINKSPAFVKNFKYRFSELNLLDKSVNLPFSNLKLYLSILEKEPFFKSKILYISEGILSFMRKNSTDEKYLFSKKSLLQVRKEIGDFSNLDLDFALAWLIFNQKICKSFLKSKKVILNYYLMPKYENRIKILKRRKMEEKI